MLRAMPMYDLLANATSFHCFACHPSSIFALPALPNSDDSPHYDFMNYREKISYKIMYQEIQLQ